MWRKTRVNRHMFVDILHDSWRLVLPKVDSNLWPSILRKPVVRIKLGNSVNVNLWKCSAYINQHAVAESWTANGKLIAAVRS